MLVGFASLASTLALLRDSAFSVIRDSVFSVSFAPLRSLCLCVKKMRQSVGGLRDQFLFAN